MWHHVLPLRGSIHGKKIAIKEVQRYFGGTIREKGRFKIAGHQLRSDLFKKNSLSNDLVDTMILLFNEIDVCNTSISLKSKFLLKKANNKDPDQLFSV